LGSNIGLLFYKHFRPYAFLRPFLRHPLLHFGVGPRQLDVHDPADWDYCSAVVRFLEVARLDSAGPG